MRRQVSTHGCWCACVITCIHVLLMYVQEIWTCTYTLLICISIWIINVYFRICEHHYMHVLNTTSVPIKTLKSNGLVERFYSILPTVKGFQKELSELIKLLMWIVCDRQLCQRSGWASSHKTLPQLARVLRQCLVVNSLNPYLLCNYKGRMQSLTGCTVPLSNLIQS
jgi:hypothetical protein